MTGPKFALGKSLYTLSKLNWLMTRGVMINHHDSECLVRAIVVVFSHVNNYHL